MLKKIYQSHNDETDKIDNLYQEYDKGVVEEIHTKLTKAGIGVSKARLLDIIYGDLLWQKKIIRSACL